MLLRINTFFSFSFFFSSDVYVMYTIHNTHVIYTRTAVRIFSVPVRIFSLVLTNVSTIRLPFAFH